MKERIKKLFEISVVISLLAFAGCSDGKISSAPDTDPEQTAPEATDPPKTLLGPFDVYYTLQTSPSTTSGTGSDPEKVSAIHFHETYIVIESSESGGRILPLDQIKSFWW